METWGDLATIMNTVPCTLRTREDFVLTGGNPNTAGSKNVFGKQYTEFAVSDSEHADDKAILFCN